MNGGTCDNAIDSIACTHGTDASNTNNIGGNIVNSAMDDSTTTDMGISSDHSIEIGQTGGNEDAEDIVEFKNSSNMGLSSDHSSVSDGAGKCLECIGSKIHDIIMMNTEYFQIMILNLPTRLMIQ